MANNFYLSLGSNKRKRLTQSGYAPRRTQIIFAKNEYLGDSLSINTDMSYVDTDGQNYVRLYKEQNIRDALSHLSKHGIFKKISSLYYTKPVGFTKQDNFVNIACKYSTDLTPTDLFKLIKKIEREMGRLKKIKDGPRIIDIDIIYFENKIYQSKDLKIPHPRMSTRAFVIYPLYEIGCEIIHPILKKSVREFRKSISDDGIIEIKPFNS